MTTEKLLVEPDSCFYQYYAKIETIDGKKNYVPKNKDYKPNINNAICSTNRELVIHLALIYLVEKEVWKK